MDAIDWPETGERVTGAYLGHRFHGVVAAVGFDKAALGRGYTVKFDAPVNVSKSALMTIMRQRVTALIGPDGEAIDDKGKPNGIMTLARA
ncbi:MAG TPA: glyoxalase superfamily protein [Caulobacteraceae bacterium]|jgi:hypothetical protein|nr:glyoxalase superfamily protein [Caulobacteraceae bacterium]